MAEMTPRERVVAAINHREPDRVPVDVGGGAGSTLVTEVTEGYERLRRHLGLAEESMVVEMSRTLVEVEGRGAQTRTGDLVVPDHAR